MMSETERILEDVARAAWRKDHPDTDCPPSEIPTEADLCKDLAEIGDEARTEMRKRMEAMGLIGPNATVNLSLDPDSPKVTHDPAASYRGILPEAWDLFSIDNTDGPKQLMFGAVTHTSGIAVWSIDRVHRQWCMAEDRRPLHPLAPIIRAWQKQRPVTIEPERRKDRGVMVVMRRENRPERQRGMLFGGLLDNRQQAELPLFEATPVRKSVAILDLADTAGVPVMAQGRGAPLSARLFVRAGLAVAPGDRKRVAVRMPLTVRELRNGLFPNGASKWGTRDWPALKAALMGAHNHTIRLPDSRRWFMLALRELPAEDARGLPSLDDFVVMDLAFPPGASDGPIIDLPTLDALSVESAPRWRAYIGAHALAWQPGVTRRPVPKARGRFGWSHNPADYPILTPDDMRRLAFGEADNKHRTRAEIEAAWHDLPGLVIVDRRAHDPKTGEIGWRILPADAARKDRGSEE